MLDLILYLDVSNFGTKPSKFKHVMKRPLYLLFLCLPASAESQDLLTSAGHGVHIHFIPTSFSNSFSANIKPVLTINAGDSVLTETIDAAGFDNNSVKRHKGGNPLTGPFYVKDSKAGMCWRLL